MLVGEELTERGEWGSVEVKCKSGSEMGTAKGEGCGEVLVMGGKGWRGVGDASCEKEGKGSGESIVSVSLRLLIAFWVPEGEAEEMVGEEGGKPSCLRLEVGVIMECAVGTDSG